ncbi:MAG: type II and III secretion system protein [Synergistaceae bacterium]|nr:type II and III secretion system protein [Synergistaceae bacterium]
MGKQKISHKLVKIFAFIFLVSAAVFAAGEARAVVSEARKVTEQESIIEGLKLHQAGSNLIMMELRGTKLSLPTAESAENAAKLVWSDIRFPRDTDRKNWWDEFEWDIIKLNKKKSEEWTQKYDFPLIEQITVTSNDKNGVTMSIIGPKPLVIKEIGGMAGSDRLRIMLEAKSDIVPPVLPKARPAPSNGPLAIKSPVTLELRDVSLREVFRMLAQLKNLNLVLDSTVPDTPMTFSFTNTPFSEVFAYMLRMNDLSYSMIDKTLVVGTADSIGKTLGQSQTRQYNVAYAEVSKLPAIIMGVVPLPKPPVVDDRLRCLYITATPEQHRQIEALMNRIDHPGKQIMIEARLVEISDGAEQEIETTIASIYRGWIFTYGSTGLGSRYTYGGSGLTPNVNPLGTTTAGNIPLVGGTSDSTMPGYLVDPAMKMLDAAFRAMESDNKGKVLASPSVVALDGQKATVKLTHNYLYQSGVDDNGNPEFTEQETGPTLEFTPTLGRDGFITINMKISTGEIIAFRQSGESETPETTKREVETRVRVRNSELFVVGGLYQENKTNTITRVPILSYIPLLGELFKSRSTQHSKSQVAFIAIPYILDIPTGAAEVLEMPEKSLYQ